MKNLITSALLFTSVSAYSATVIVNPPVIQRETGKELFYKLMIQKPSYTLIDGGIKLPQNMISADTLIKNEDGTIELINMSNNLKPTL